jgi:hypothetical protein
MKRLVLILICTLILLVFMSSCVSGEPLLNAILPSKPMAQMTDQELKDNIVDLEGKTLRVGNSYYTQAILYVSYITMYQNELILRSQNKLDNMIIP